MKLFIRQWQSPGDILMLTAAVQNGRYGLEIDGKPRLYFDLYPQFYFKEN